MVNKISINKIIADIKATKGNRAGCQGLHSSLESDGYITPIYKWTRATSPDRIDALVAEVEKLRVTLAASLNAENVWEKTMMEVCGEDGPASVAAEIAALRAQRDTALESLRQQLAAVVAENAGMKQIIHSVTDLSNEPKYHAEGMGCGLEDRGITDRYDACRYGWDEAMERIYGEVIPCAEEIAFPATDAFLAEVRAQGVEMFSAYCGEENSVFVEAKAYYRSLPDAAYEFAEQLRKGVQS